MQTLPRFDGPALIAALDAQRVARGLDWNQLSDALYEQSSDLNAELCDHGVCSGALIRTAKRGTMSCQYAAMLLRWIGRPPEDFLAGPKLDVGPTTLPKIGPDKRLRFELPALHATLDDRRRAEGLTWAALGEELGCSPARLTNLRTARLADMGLTMQLTQWLRVPAATFLRAERW